MTENFLIAAAILTLVAVFILDGYLVYLAIVVCVTLGLLSGYGVLPAWQG